MSYYALKHLHMAFALVSGLLFAFRGAWMLRDSRLAQRRSLRLASSLIDTALLASAIGLVIWSAQYPFVHTWVTVKVVAVLAYIAAGIAAMRAGSRRARLLAFGTALLLFAYILKLAFTKQIL